jgi:hypothetical protein
MSQPKPTQDENLAQANGGISKLPTELSSACVPLSLFHHLLNCDIPSSKLIFIGPLANVANQPEPLNSWCGSLFLLFDPPLSNMQP